MRLYLRTMHKAAGWTALAGIVLPLGACHEYIDPWTDKTAGPEMVTTASVEGTLAQQAAPSSRQHRGTEATLISPQDGTVGHYPLRWEDPFEDRGSDDGQYAWTWEDYVAMPYGLARFILNTACLPASVVVQPPVPLMSSDGVISRQALGHDHDAQWLPSGRSPTPPDILELGSVPPDGDDSSG